MYVHVYIFLVGSGPEVVLNALCYRRQRQFVGQTDHQMTQSLHGHGYLDIYFKKINCVIETSKNHQNYTFVVVLCCFSQNDTQL